MLRKHVFTEKTRKKLSRALLGNQNARKPKLTHTPFDYRLWCAAKAKELADHWYQKGGTEYEIDMEQFQAALREAYSRGYGDASNPIIPIPNEPTS